MKVTAAGYDNAEFTINEYDFKDRKKEWEVLLRKEKPKVKVAKARSVAATNIGNETRIRMGAISNVAASSSPLFVVDGAIVPSSIDINPDDVAELSVLQGSAASALYGPDGLNGAIIITTRKSKEKMSDTVHVKTPESGATVSDQKIFEPIDTEHGIKLYPNPVQAGQALNLVLQPGTKGLHSIVITDVMGRVVLQQLFNAANEVFIEKISTDARWGSGLFYITIFDDINKLIDKSSFIVRL